MNFALDVARSWRKLGDTQHLNDYLNRVWDSPLAHRVAPRERAWKFLAFGFVEEGKRRLVALGIGPQEPIYQYASVAYFEGFFNLKNFPAWIQTVRDPQRKLAALDSFSLGLVESREQLREEREFVLSAAGYSYSY